MPLIGGGIRFGAPRADAWIPQNNFEATTNPGVTDDTDAGYSVGSMWINTDSNHLEIYQCVDPTAGAAVWDKLDTKTFVSSIDPTANDDEDFGHYAGEFWLNQTTDELYVCTDASSGAAVWKEVAVGGGTVHVRVADPTVNDDSSSGYDVGEFWWNTAGRNLFIAKDVTVGAAVWDNLFNATTGGTISGATTINAALTMGGNIAMGGNDITGAGSITATTVTDGTWSTTAGVFSGVAGITLTGNITMPEDGWIGIGAAAERIVFDGTGGLLTVTASNLRMDSTNRTEYRDAQLYISSQNNGYLDFDADTGFRFNTASLLGVGPTTFTNQNSATRMFTIEESSAGAVMLRMRPLNGGSCGVDDLCVISHFISGRQENTYWSNSTYAGCIAKGGGGDSYTQTNLLANTLLAVLDDGGVGIGTTTVPHGGIGAAKLAIEGADSTIATGPNLQFTTSNDDYPLIQIVPYAHDNIGFYFDSYADSTFTEKSSDAGSNFLIKKAGDKLHFYAEAGIAQGSNIAFVDVFYIESDAEVLFSPNAARKFKIRDDLISISSGSDGIGQLEADGYWRVGTGTTTHSLAANGDFLVSGKLEVDGIGYFDGTIQNSHATQSDLLFLQSSTPAYLIRPDYSFDQVLLAVADTIGRQIILTNYGSRAVDHGHATQTNPTLYGHSANSPATNPNEWWSITHDQTDAVFAWGTGILKLDSGGISAANLKSGANQGAAGAAAGELWVDTSAANVVKLGV